MTTIEPSQLWKKLDGSSVIEVQRVIGDDVLFTEWRNDRGGKISKNDLVELYMELTADEVVELIGGERE